MPKMDLSMAVHEHSDQRALGPESSRPCIACMAPAGTFSFQLTESWSRIWDIVP